MFLTILALAIQTMAPIHRALLVGVDDYKKAIGTDIAWWDLTSDKDVTALKAALLSSGEFQASDIHTLSGTVTKSQVLAQLKWLTSDDNPNDVLFFHFSGHGYATQKKNAAISGTGNRDNGLVLSDSKGGDPAHMLMSSELAGILNSAKSDHVLATFDACNSGGLMRGLNGRYRPRGLQSSSPPQSAPFVTATQKVVVFSAAQFNQDANEDDSGGVFSNALAHGFAQLNGDNVTYRDLFDTVDASMRATADVDQNPVPAGDLDRTIFTGRQVAASNYFPVRIETRSRKQEIVMEAGQVHRLTPGSEVAIYKEEVSGSPLAYATVTNQVGVGESVLTLKPGSAPLTSQGDRPFKGVVTQLAAGDGVLSLLEDSSCQGKSPDWLAKLPSDQPVKTIQQGQYDLKLSYASAQWTLLDSDGTTLDQEADSDAGKAKIEDAIGQVSRWKSIKHLDNPLGSQVSVSIRLRHVVTTTEGETVKFKSAEALGADEQHFAKSGYFAVQVCAKPAASGQAAWQPSVAVLELKANHGVQQLWPADLSAQDKYRLPLDGQWHWLADTGGFVDSPAGSADVSVLQFVPEGSATDADGVGSQTFKIMATKDPVPYQGLLDDGVIHGRGATSDLGNSPLGKLIARYSLGTRGPAVTGTVAAKDWATNSFTAINTKG